MNEKHEDRGAQTAQDEAKNEQPERKKEALDQKLQDPHIYDQYDKAMGELGDAESAASAGGPAI